MHHIFLDEGKSAYVHIGDLDFTITAKDGKLVVTPSDVPAPTLADRAEQAQIDRDSIGSI